MAISSSPLNNSAALSAQIGQIRDDAQALQKRSSNLAGSFNGIQDTAYDSYNQCQSAYENAWDASSDDGTKDSSGNGAAINGTLPGLNANQQNLHASGPAAATEVSYCQGEVSRVYSQLAALAATLTPGALGPTLQAALENLGQASTDQQQIQFDSSVPLAQTDALLGSVATEAAGIAADAPGGDVSATAQGAMKDLQTSQFYYQQIASGAQRSGMGQLQVSQSCSAAIDSLDEALEMLEPPDQKAPPVG